MSYSQEQIEQFLKLGEPREKMFLWWWDRESFFDEAVQKVLMELHPDKINYPSDLEKAFPVDAWSVADSFRLAQSPDNFAGLAEYLMEAPPWMADLLAAVMRYRPGGPDTLQDIEKWRTERYLWETGQQHTEEQREEVLKAIKYWERVYEGDPSKLTPEELKARQLHENTPEKFRGAKPIKLPLSTPPLKRWMDGKGGLSPEAYRQAASRENKRRDKIMRHWAESWLAHLGVTEKPEKM